MPESAIPTYVDTRKTFLQHDQISGTISLQKLPRFMELLTSHSGIVKVELEFLIDESKQRVIQGNLVANVEVTCQRCLEPLEIQLQDNIRLALVTDEEEVSKLDSSLDPWFSNGHRLILAELVEEQLMLCMPIVNSHHNSQFCLEILDYNKNDVDLKKEHLGARNRNPFFALKTLKK
tara:strand:+ start:772 stop:1302 length:531 start_codon:yes stop_codon:yes gene_type:complete